LNIFILTYTGCFMGSCWTN